MGIPGLLDQLKSVIIRSHVSDLKGKSVAIDAHCWLHRGAFACSKELVLGNPTEKYISFFMGMINMLKRNGISSILVVFDGISLPNKSETNKRRSEDRKKNTELARNAEASGDQALAMTYYQRSVSVIFEMIRRLLAVLSREGVPFMISPYESDAQLAFLSKTGFVDLIITEDSDSIPYGCASVLFKLDKEGYGDLFEKSKLHTNQTLSFAAWTEDQFTLFCCLAGCDYMPGLRNFGIKTAYKVVQKHKTLSKVLDHLLLSSSAAAFNGSLATHLERALLTFKHQTVYNPETMQTEPLTALPLHLTYLNNQEVPAVSSTGVRGSVQRSSLHTSEVEFAFLGPQLDPHIARQLVRGEIDPHTIGTATVEPASSVLDAGRGSGGAGGTNTASLNALPTSQPSLPVPTLPSLPRTPAPVRSVSQGPTIRWMSSEDRALHTSHVLRRGSADDTATNSARATNTSTAATNGNGSYTIGSKRQRTTNTLTQGQGGGISRAAALHTASVYSSDLVSDSLLPLHRRTRLRTVEPVYGSGVSGSSGGDWASAYAGGSGDDGGGDVWGDSSYDVAYNTPPINATAGTSHVSGNLAAATNQRTSFFDELQPVSPIHIPDAYLPATDDTYLADYNTDDAYPQYATYDTTYYTTNPNTTYGVDDSLASHIDDDYCETGLPQFQDALFEERMAHKYSLHNSSRCVSNVRGCSSVAGGSAWNPKRSPYDRMYGVTGVDRGAVHSTHPAHTIAHPFDHRTTLAPRVPPAGIWPKDTMPTTSTFPTASCPSTAHTSRHLTYPLNPSVDRYTARTTPTIYPNEYPYTYSAGLRSALHYTPRSQYMEDCRATTARSNRNAILHDVGVSEDCWRRHLFPGLQVKP